MPRFDVETKANSEILSGANRVWTGDENGAAALSSRIAPCSALCFFRGPVISTLCAQARMWDDRTPNVGLKLFGDGGLRHLNTKESHGPMFTGNYGSHLAHVPLSPFFLSVVYSLFTTKKSQAQLIHSFFFRTSVKVPTSSLVSAKDPLSKRCINSSTTISRNHWMESLLLWEHRALNQLWRLWTKFGRAVNATESCCLLASRGCSDSWVCRDRKSVV